MALTLIVVICGLYPIFTARYCTAYSYMHSHRLNSYLSSVLQNHTIPTARSSLVDSKQLVYRIEPRIPNLPIHGCRRFSRHGSMNGKHNMVRYGCKMRWCPDLWFRPPSVHTLSTPYFTSALCAFVWTSSEPPYGGRFRRSQEHGGAIVWSGMFMSL